MNNHTPKILIVDDEDLVRELLVYYLNSDGRFQVEEAPDGYGAVSKTILKKFDLAILDFAMPGFNGMEAMKTMMRNCPYLKFIITTGMTDKVLFKTCEELGCRIVNKPVEKKVLLDAVCSTLKIESSNLHREETIRGRGI